MYPILIGRVHTMSVADGDPPDETCLVGRIYGLKGWADGSITTVRFVEHVKNDLWVSGSQIYVLVSI